MALNVRFIFALLPRYAAAWYHNDILAYSNGAAVCSHKAVDWPPMHRPLSRP
jgi:hypothetical protein